MKIIVWHNCRVMHEFDVPDAPGPNIEVDPWNNLVSTSGNGRYEVPIPYHEGLS